MKTKKEEIYLVLYDRNDKIIASFNNWYDLSYYFGYKKYSIQTMVSHWLQKNNTEIFTEDDKFFSRLVFEFGDSISEEYAKKFNIRKFKGCKVYKFWGEFDD